LIDTNIRFLFPAAKFHRLPHVLFSYGHYTIFDSGMDKKRCFYFTYCLNIALLLVRPLPKMIR